MAAADPDALDEPDPAADPDTLDAEQGRVDRAYQWLAAMRDRATALRDETDPVSFPELFAALDRRVALLADNGRALCFGRIDEVDGPAWYIGRHHVEDDLAEPVVVEWRAPVAAPYYQATLAEPQGLSRRRQFVADGPNLLSMADDWFVGAAAAAHGDLRVRGRDALLAELDRRRTGEMLDIVATIQVEQDAIIRAPLAGIIAVQGGPGTGKTAVGLHRAAFLLYGNDALARSGVLVLGPNRTFLKYIAMVLPSLGEEAVVQTTLADLVPEVRVRAEDTVLGQRVKGDARMAEVLVRALDQRRQPLDEDLDLWVGAVHLDLPAQRANELGDGVAARRLSYASGRDTLREQLIRAIYDRYIERTGRLAAPELATIARSLRSHKVFQASVDRMWPSVSPTALVRELLTNRAALERAAASTLTSDEQAAIYRRPARKLADERWTEADGPLVDEAKALILGQSRTYGHIVVDEGQDLSPMQLRMLSRRGPTGSMTLLGDLAQGIGVWAHDDWADLLAYLPAPDGARLEVLSLGYRAPAQVLDLASRLLPVAAPQVDPTESIRPGHTEPVILQLPAEGRTDDLATAAAAEAVRLVESGLSAAVIAPTALVDALASALGRQAIDWAPATEAGLDHRIVLLPAPAAKGLEFDAVVVVEPAAIVEDAPRGLRLLYVAMTRPTQHLSIVHRLPLPIS
jgi:DNA helicase IV